MAKSRNVEYTLKIVADGGNGKATAEAVKQFKEVEAASHAAAKAAKEAMTATARSYARGGAGGVNASSTGTAQATRNAERGINRELDAALRERAAIFEREKKLMADRIRANTAASAAARDAARETKAGHYRGRAVNSEIDFASHVDSLGKQYAQSERSSRQAAAASSQAWKQAGAAIVATTNGVIGYGRAIALISAADEETAQRMLKKIAHFEAFASVLTGTVQIWKAGAAAAKAYQAAAAGAALAQGAGGMARGAGMGGQIAGVARSAGRAGLIAGGIGLAAGAGMVGLSALGDIAKGRGVKESLGKASRDIWEGVTEFLGISDRAMSAAKEAKQRAQKARQDMEHAGVRFSVQESGYRERFDIEREQAMLAAGPRGIDQVRASLKATRSEIDFKDFQQGSLSNSDGIEKRQAIAESLKQYRRQELNDVREIARIELEAKRSKIDGEKQALNALRDRLRESSRAMQDAQNASKSAKVRFGMMSESEQMQTLNAVRMLRERKPLTRDAEEKLRNIGGIGTTYADESAAKRAEKAGWGDVYKNLFQPSEFKARAMSNSLNAKVDVKHEIVARLEADATAFEQSATKALSKIYDKLLGVIDSKIDMAVRKIDSDHALQDATGSGS